MARIINDGEVKVQWVITIATKSAPTIGEINAGTDITPFLSSLDTPLEGDSVDSSDLSSAFNKNVAGTFGGGATGQFYKDDTADTAYTTFPRNTTGHLVVRRFGGSAVAFAVANNVEVWEVRVVTRSPATMDRNNVQMFQVDYATLDEPDLDVAVAA